MVSAPQVAKVWADAARGAAPTSAGTQDFVFAGEEPGDGAVTDGLVRRGSPKLALFFATNCTANDTATDDAVLFFGACELDNGGSEKHHVRSMFAEHNVSTTNTVKRGATDVCCMIIDSAGAVDGEAVFDSISQDGTTGDITVSIDWTNPPSAAILVTCVVLGGSAVSVDMDTHSNSGSANNGGTKVHTLSNLDVEPTILIFHTAGSQTGLGLTDAASAKGAMGLGFACHNGTSIEQAGQTFLYADGVSVAAGQAWQGWGNRVMRSLVQTVGPLSSQSGSIEISDMTTGTAGEYETTTRDWVGSTSVINWGVIGIGIDSDEVDVHISEPLATNGTPLSTQTWDVAHTPILNLYLMSMMNMNSNVEFSNNNGQPHGIGVIAGDANVFCASIANRRNVATSNTQSRVDTKPVNLNTHTGGTGHQADYDSLTVGTGHVVDWTNHNGSSADGFKLLSIQRAPTVIGMDVVDAELNLVADGNEPVTPPDTGAETLQLVTAAPEPVTPPEPPVSVLRLVADTPEVVTPLDVATQALQLIATSPDVVTPATSPLSLLQLVAAPPSVPTLIDPGLSGLILTPGAVQVSTPIQVASGALQIAHIAPGVVSPVSTSLSILRLVAGPTGVLTPVEVGAKVLQLVATAPTVMTPVSVDPSTLRLTVPVYTPPIADELLSLDIVTPVNVSSQTLQLVANAPDIVIPPLVASSTLRLVPNPPTPFTPITLTAATLRISATAPDVMTPIGVALNSLLLSSTPPAVPTLITPANAIVQLVAFPPVIEVTGGGVTLVQAPHSILQLIANAPAVVTGQGCYEWLHNTLRQRFAANISVPTIFDNDPEEPPEDALWARFNVQNEDHVLARVGGNGLNTYRKSGIAKTSIYVPLESGDKAALAVADDIDTAFRDLTDNIVFRTPSLNTIGRQGRWWVTEMLCPWYFDDIRPAKAVGGGWTLPDFEAMHNVHRSRFKTLVEDVESVVTVYDNDPQEPPEDTMWVRWSVRPGESRRVENGGAAGSHRYRTPGVAIAQIFAPLEQGDMLQLRLADVIVSTFRGVTVSGVTYRTPRVENIGREGRWWQINVVCPFYADDIG